MQGRKEIYPKMMYRVHIGDLIPKDNFYRILDRELNLSYLYKATRHYYGDEGQESIAPVVFFKICLVGYLNNITSDRRLIEYCNDSLAIRLYLKYDIDESLPWRSTISRTRQLYGMKRVNTKSISGAEKHVLMAAMCYNLQKLLRFRKLNSGAIAIKKQANIDIFTDKFLVCFSPVFARLKPK